MLIFYVLVVGILVVVVLVVVVLVVVVLVVVAMLVFGRVPWEVYLLLAVQAPIYYSSFVVSAFARTHIQSWCQWWSATHPTRQPQWLYSLRRLLWTKIIWYINIREIVLFKNYVKLVKWFRLELKQTMWTFGTPVHR